MADDINDPTNFNVTDESDNGPADRIDVPIDYGTPQEFVRADLPADNLFIAQNGILWMHYKAMPCVLGKTDFDNLRHSHDHAYQNKGSPVFCENGMMYVPVDKVFGVFVNNAKDVARWPGGWIPNGTAQVTFNRYYKETSEPAYFSKYDKLVPVICPDDFFAEHSQELVTNPTGSDTLQFEPKKVLYIFDSNGNQYAPGADFTIEGCKIVWGANRPGLGPTGKPMILSIRYRYQPSYYVKYVVHEQRLKAEIDLYSQEVKMKGGPTQCVVEQDYVFLENRFKDNAPNSQPTSGQGGNTSPR